MGQHLRAHANLRNEQLQYAINWYAQAIALVVILVLFHLRQRQAGI